VMDGRGGIGARRKFGAGFLLIGDATRTQLCRTRIWKEFRQNPM